MCLNKVISLSLSCVISYVSTGRQGTLAYNSFRWRAIRLFNSLPKSIRDITNGSVCSIASNKDFIATSTVFLISPALLATTTVCVVEIAYNVGHFVMT